MHLHVGVDIGDDDILLIVKQTPDAVLFCCLARHRECFAQPPLGRELNKAIGSKLAKSLFFAN